MSIALFYSLSSPNYNVFINTFMPTITVQDLKKNYKNTEAVQGISFEVHDNEIFGILGPNGAGKTTTLEIMEGLKKQTSGKCFILGFDNIAQIKEIKKHIGVQLQSSEYLNYLRLAELLVLFASLYKQKVDPAAILKKVGLESKADCQIKELSGGQKQRFTIASALVHKPQILFLDEPTTGLDPQARRKIWTLIKDLNNQGITIVMTTHYMEEAEYLCDRVAIMDQGQILKIESPQKLIHELSSTYKLSFFINKRLGQDFFKQPAVQNVYIEYPKVSLEIERAEALPEIIEKLNKNQVSYSFLNLKTATLEDVYLHLTGHEYQA